MKLSALSTWLIIDNPSRVPYIRVAAFEGVSSVASDTNGVRMAKAKKTKSRERLLRWRVSLMKATPAKFIDYVEAPDAKTAEDTAAKEHRISDTLRDRLVAIRED
jgi:hypothetical protein